MIKQTIAAVLFSLAASLGLTAAAQAGIILQSTSSYDSPLGYDYVTTFPPAGSTTIGTYAFSIPAGVSVSSVTISGTFGNGDSPTTALSDYYLGFGGNETAVKVASCDSAAADCASNNNGPTALLFTLTQPQIAALATGLSGGSLDFTYTWDTTPAFAIPSVPQYIYAGAATIDIAYSPEPATLLFCFSGMAGFVVLRRFRRV